MPPPDSAPKPPRRRMKETVLGPGQRERFCVTLDGRTLVALQALVAQRGCSVTETLRDAVITEKYLADLVAGGDKIFAKSPTGEIRELVFRW